MAGVFIANRIKFSRSGEQRRFIVGIQNSLNCTWSELAKRINVHPRTLRDWVLEKFRLSEESFNNMCSLARLTKIPKVEIISLSEHLSKISRQGGIALYKKYGQVGGDKTFRHEQWNKWWNSVGKQKVSPSLRDIIIPSYNEDLAEFMGIMIGDGGVAPYHISITLNSIDEKEYAEYVSDLLFRLFGIQPKIYKKKESNAIDLIIQRKRLVDYCVSNGLKRGNKNKQNVDIPEWVRSNPNLIIPYIRGLFDTDGSMYVHKYRSGGKSYSYPKLQFSSESQELIYSVHNVLKNMGFCARMDKRKENSIYIENQNDVKRFMRLIGSNNPKHWKVFKKSGDVPEPG